MHNINNIKLHHVVLFDIFSFYYHPNDQFVGATIAKNQYELFESLLVLSHVKKGDIVIDIGANIGYYSLLLAYRVGNSGHVYAFEPDPLNRKILTKNIDANNLNNITISDAAIDQAIGKAKLYLSEENFGDHRLFLDKSEEQQRNRIKIRCETLDHLFCNTITEKPISFIKIDTQGYEPFVIAGGRQLICKYKPTIFLEYWPYGYRHSNANAIKMNQFLRKIYHDLVFISETSRRFFSVTDLFINNYCKQFKHTQHCNLICSLHSLDFLREMSYTCTCKDKLTMKIKQLLCRS